ncbi:hypothetical protein DIX40_00750 [Streptococcus pneumoniae]|nr:hypothetical protein [Streptococcus pneumoniae]MDA5260578.1 hypothetical protein [Streptococcus pneumoniae]
MFYIFYEFCINLFLVMCCNSAIIDLFLFVFTQFILYYQKNKVRILFLTFDNFTDSLVLHSACTKCLHRLLRKDHVHC